MTRPSPMVSSATAQTSPAQRARLVRAASYASLSVALGLAVAKAWAWQATMSVSVLSSLADSLLDVAASALTFWAVRKSLVPKDTLHRFGHGKAEGLAALIQALIIMASGGYVILESVRRFIEPRAVEQPAVGVAVMLVATAVTGVLVTFQAYVKRRTGSVAIGADAMHYKTDVAINLGVAASIVIAAATDWWIADPLVGLAVAAFIVRGALGIFGDAIAILLDREIPDADREKIKAIACAHPEVHGLHDMKTRFGGTNYIVQFHLDLSPALSLWRSHEILDEVEAAILADFPGCEIIIHPDPIGFPELREHYD